jgi:hypothetical protein
MLKYDTISGYKNDETIQIGQVINILCYSICFETEIPFIQYMFEHHKSLFDPFNSVLTLPKFTVMNNEPIKEIFNRIKHNLLQINCDGNLLDETMFKGYIIQDNEVYAIINITGIDITSLHISMMSGVWFILPSEIISVNSVCNIDIDPQVTYFFQKNIELSLLQSPDNTLYNVPDVCYSGDTIKKVEFKSIFGQTEETRNNIKSYYFFDNFNNAVKEGGWLKEGGNKYVEEKILNKMIKNGIIEKSNIYGKYLNGGINRYAVFCNLDIDDDMLLGEPNIKIYNYNMIMPLSYHSLSSFQIGEKYDFEKEYIIL